MDYCLIHTAEDAYQACTQADKTVHLKTASGAGVFLGSRWFLSLQSDLEQAFPKLTIILWVDYGDAVGAALASLKQGVKYLLFHGDTKTLTKLQNIAQKTGAQVLDTPPPIA